MNFILKNRLLAAATLFVIVVAPLSFLMFSGCASKLAGNQIDNEPPEVGFINSPPESTNFSRNSVIYWWGTDRDGLIDFFRYHVATVDQMGGLTPDAYIAGVANNKWTVVDVNVVNSNPGTEKIIKMSADLNDPVNKFVLQYVFLQAFDEEGKSSPIVWRLFGRNDNPPQTILFNPSDLDLPFVNAKTSGGIITGVKMSWRAEDPIDYPSDPPPFDFHYRLYGPYDSAQYAQLQAQFFQKRYLTADGKIYKIGDTIVTCDTVVQIPQQINCDSLGVCDTVNLPPDTTINCTTLIVRSTTPASAFGSLQDYFAIDAPSFDTTKLVFESRNPVDTSDVWNSKTADTIFNVFKNFNPVGAADTTVEMTYVFWIRCRDDALVPDLIPSFKGVTAINPRYERGILVIDMTSILLPNRRWSIPWLNELTAKNGWYELVKHWAGSDVSKYLDTTSIPGSAPRQSPDYYVAARGGNKIPISTLLKHKVAILYKEDCAPVDLSGVLPTLYKGIDAGVNVMVCGRSLNGGGKNQPFTISSPGAQDPLRYARYFGVIGVVFGGWGCHAFGSNNRCPEMRMEDFVGAYPKPGWPDITIDTSLLHNKLKWADPSDVSGNYPAAGWIDSCPNPPGSCAPPTNYGLPEVGWSIRTFGTDLLYRYKSYYGAAHPLGRGEDYDFIFEGAPLCFRLNAGLYRTVHCNFTLLAVDTNQARVFADSIFNWLYDPNLGSPTSKVRYPEAQLQISIQEAKEDYRRMVQEYELLKDTRENTDGSEY